MRVCDAATGSGRLGVVSLGQLRAALKLAPQVRVILVASQMLWGRMACHQHSSRLMASLAKLSALCKGISPVQSLQLPNEAINTEVGAWHMHQQHQKLVHQIRSVMCIDQLS